MMECRVATGLPSPIITWERDGEIVNQSENVKFISNYQILQIKEVSLDAAGRYTCNAQNIAGSDYRNFIVTVHTPPKMEKNFDDESSMEIIAYGSLTLDCKIHGGAITWYKDARLIDQSERIRLSPGNRKLFILNADSEDEGEYTCTSTNIAGTTRRVIDVTVLGQG